MTDEYTPTVEEVRGAYAKWIADPEWFDRMIAGVERAAAVKARQDLIDAVDEVKQMFGGQEFVSTAVLESEAQHLDRIESEEQA